MGAVDSLVTSVPICVIGTPVNIWNAVNIWNTREHLEHS
jgi:hypothetical protein